MRFTKHEMKFFFANFQEFFACILEQSARAAIDVDVRECHGSKHEYLEKPN